MQYAIRSTKPHLEIFWSNYYDGGIDAEQGKRGQKIGYAKLKAIITHFADCQLRKKAPKKRRQI